MNHSLTNNFKNIQKKIQIISILIGLKLYLQSRWWDGWVAETTSLLNWRTGNCSGGSNPPLTAKAKAPSWGFFRFRASLRARKRARNEKRTRCRDFAARAFALMPPPSGITTEKSNPLMGNRFRASLRAHKRGLGFGDFAKEVGASRPSATGIVLSDF